MITNACVKAVLGTAKVIKDGQHPGVFKDAVATPGGCTVYGILKLEEGNLRSTVSEAIKTCAARAQELGKK